MLYRHYQRSGGKLQFHTWLKHHQQTQARRQRDAIVLPWSFWVVMVVIPLASIGTVLGIVGWAKGWW